MRGRERGAVEVCVCVCVWAGLRMACIVDRHEHRADDHHHEKHNFLRSSLFILRLLLLGGAIHSRVAGASPSKGAVSVAGGCQLHVARDSSGEPLALTSVRGGIGVAGELGFQFDKVRTVVAEEEVIGTARPARIGDFDHQVVTRHAAQRWAFARFGGRTHEDWMTPPRGCA